MRKRERDENSMRECICMFSLTLVSVQYVRHSLTLNTWRYMYIERGAYMIMSVLHLIVQCIYMITCLAVIVLACMLLLCALGIALILPCTCTPTCYTDVVPYTHV